MNKQADRSIPLHSMKNSTPLGLEFRYVEMSDGRADAIIESDKNVAHRDDYYLFLFTDTAESYYILDFQEMRIEGKSLLYIRPGQVHFARSIKSAKGWALAIDPMLIDGEYKKIFEERFTTQQAINLQPDIAQTIESTAHLLLKATRATQTAVNNCTLIHLANVYIGLWAELYAQQQEEFGDNKSRSTLIANQFRHLLSEYFKTVKSPSEYARMLNYSLSHLNESVKNVTGSTVSHLIHQQVVLEAKRMLYYTNLDVKEIAFQLGYEDHTYFSRLFSKTAGMSPIAFRNKFHE